MDIIINFIVIYIFKFQLIKYIKFLTNKMFYSISYDYLLISFFFFFALPLNLTYSKF